MVFYNHKYYTMDGLLSFDQLTPGLKDGKKYTRIPSWTETGAYIYQKTMQTAAIPQDVLFMHDGQNDGVAHLHEKDLQATDWKEVGAHV